MIDKIVHIYEHILPKLPIMLSHEEALKYFERLMINGNIITYIKDGELLGFIEYFRINYEQFGRLCANITLTHDEDIINGNICLITRMYIIPDLRNTYVFLTLGKKLIDKNMNVTSFAAFQYHKKHKQIQVYQREEILKHFKMGE